MSTRSLAGSHGRGGQAQQEGERDGREGGEPAAARGPAAARAAGAADGRLDQRVREAEETQREEHGGDRGDPVAAGLEAAGHDQHLAHEQRRGRQAGERGE